MALPVEKTSHPHGPKTQTPTAVYAFLPLIAEVIPKLSLCILKLFPQSLNNSNNSSSKALRGKILWSLIYKTIPVCYQAATPIL